ncbi:DUF3795 domain-containing protein [Maridesulfovibrio frigidus]|uniref:DUF3795 domain-containing protein n=1 Tax=Maridesulfovibrio frigidus TaxID=340956 RepID=UPI0004E11FA1|nr:DUF3795 domain-containing protein [Maridesulfovibrio frigidus]
MSPQKTPTSQPSLNSKVKLAPRHLVAPCGLDCSRCLGCSEGNVADHAQAISEVMGDNFQIYADRLKAFNPAMEEYSSFRALLDSLAKPSCGGCRSENRTCLPSCKVSECVREKKIEFCFECDNFTDCESTGLPESLFERWKNNNIIMKEIGVDNYMKGLAERPRYP